MLVESLFERIDIVSVILQQVEQHTGIEIAPFTLGALPHEITAERRRELRAAMSEEGLDFAGLHWLLAGPAGLHVTTPDETVRRRSWNYVRDLIDLCADLATNPPVMVFGSPKQRGTTAGATREEATRHFIAGFRELAPHAEARKVTLLVEALPAGQCDVVQTLAEAAANRAARLSGAKPDAAPAPATPAP